MARSPVDRLDVSVVALHNTRDKLIKIRQLRFPFYRNLEAQSRLPFEFPITLLLGRNGANKSSILHALAGSVKQGTIADYWFETQLDAIPETRDGLKQSVTHTYCRADGTLVESIKARAPRRAADPDYWEAVKPTVKYGFPPKAKRVPPISVPVLHLDFRAELPAFDKYFYFPDRRHLTRLANRARAAGRLRREYRKQDYLRRRSGLLRHRLDENATLLSDDELRLLAYVLERSYSEGAILTHDIFHGHGGRTVRFKTQEFGGGYSEAFAGSGESAAAFLIHDVIAAQDGSLVLLDEPETSLHPRAQRRMLEFLCHYAVRKSLQVVMATHSYAFAEGLPQSAIRVLELLSTGRVRVSTTYTAREALHEIDALPPGKVALVEDRRAKHLVLSALEKEGPQVKTDIKVQVREGGTGQIFRDILSYINSDRDDLFVILDGDHRPVASIPNDGELPQGLLALTSLVRSFTRGKNEQGPDISFVSAHEATRYLRFLRDQVHFLPGATPEALVWSDETAASILGVAEVPRDLAAESDAKQRLHKTAELAVGLDDDAIFKLMVRDFLLRSSVEQAALAEIVTSMRLQG